MQARQNAVTDLETIDLQETRGEDVKEEANEDELQEDAWRGRGGPERQEQKAVECQSQLRAAGGAKSTRPWDLPNQGVPTPLPVLPLISSYLCSEMIWPMKAVSQLRCHEVGTGSRGCFSAGPHWRRARKWVGSTYAVTATKKVTARGTFEILRRRMCAPGISISACLKGFGEGKGRARAVHARSRMIRGVRRRDASEGLRCPGER